ncbi:MAG: hypothetical protein GEV03_25225 [Streptosporangiales bacterium]|nr:hypothetical protein [Streptosporangiales bacterium]
MQARNGHLGAGAGEDELPLEDLLARSQTLPLSPPISAPAGLPFDQLAPRVFERLVAEVVWRVDGMNNVRIYGRSGQDQGGLDIVGRRGTSLHVYQVRRVRELTPGALRKAVEDFAVPKPSRRSRGEESHRRFDADRFVLATARVADDTAVEDELVDLQRRYADDLEIDLYDRGQLSRMLRERGSLVRGIFGPDWARAFCGHEAPSAPTTPDGRALLNDPVDVFGLGDLCASAENLDATDPASAAEGFADLARRLEEMQFPSGGRQWRARQRDAYHSAGDIDRAFATTMQLLLDQYDDGEDLHSEASQATVLAEVLGRPATEAAEVATAIADWAERGYDLGRVTQALEVLVAADDPLAGRLVVTVAEQVVVDEYPPGAASALSALASRLVGRLGENLRVRLECCIADLAVSAGDDPAEAFAGLTRRALGGYCTRPLAALILRRSGRALAFAGRRSEAVEAYRRAVLDAAESDHGGDARDALRAISYLSDIGSRDEPLRSARSIPTLTRLGSEFQIVAGGLGAARHAAAAVLVVLVTVAFMGLSIAATRMLFTPSLPTPSPAAVPQPAAATAPGPRPGPASAAMPAQVGRGEPSAWMVAPVVAGVVALLVLGVHPPDALAALLERGVALLGGGV